MRIFVGILGVLAVLVGVAGGLFGALVTGDVDTDGSWKCSSTAADSNGTVDQSCAYDSYASPTAYDRQRDLGLETVVGGAALVVGGCALIGGAAAGGGRKPQQPVYQPQPVAVGGPPSYGGYQGGQPAGGDAPPRS